VTNNKLLGIRQVLYIKPKTKKKSNVGLRTRVLRLRGTDSCELFRRRRRRLRGDLILLCHAPLVPNDASTRADPLQDSLSAVR